MNSSHNHQYNEIMNKRAARLATSKDTLQESNLYERVVIVSIESEKFAIPMNTLSSITHLPQIASLPHLPPAMAGIVQMRGELLAVVNLARWFELGDTNGKFLAIVEDKRGKLGLMVDHVHQFRDISEDEIENSFYDRDVSSKRPIKAITKDMVLLLDMKQLFESDEIIVEV